jgi:hypothetical protein
MKSARFADALCALGSLMPCQKVSGIETEMKIKNAAYSKVGDQTRT